jgi:hypothetical protein
VAEEKTPPSNGDTYPVETPPLFPSGDGAAPGAVILNPPTAPASEGGPAPTDPPGADGFGVETFTTVDNSTPGELITTTEIIDETAVTLELPAMVEGIGLDVGDVLCPNAANFIYTDDAYPNGRVQWTFFIPRRTITVAGVSIYVTAANNAGQEFEVAVFEHGTGDSKLRDSGPVAQVYAAHTWVRTNFSSPIELTAGLVFRIAFWQRNSVSASVALMLLACGSNGYVKQTGDNVNNWLIGLGGGLAGPPSIPSDLALLAAPAATFSDRAPVMVLHPA